MSGECGQIGCVSQAENPEAVCLLLLLFCFFVHKPLRQTQEAEDAASGFVLAPALGTGCVICNNPEHLP